MSSNYYGGIAGELADEGSAAEAAFPEWASTYTRVEEDRGRTTWDDMRAAFMAGRANLGGEALAAIREYRIYIDEDGGGIRMHGPCAETVGCLFGRLFDAYPSMREDIALGQLIDAALEHERDKERLHAAQMRAEQDPDGPPEADDDPYVNEEDDGRCIDCGAELGHYNGCIGDPEAMCLCHLCMGDQAVTSEARCPFHGEASEAG